MTEQTTLEARDRWWRVKLSAILSFAEDRHAFCPACGVLMADDEEHDDSDEDRMGCWLAALFALAAAPGEEEVSDA